MPISPSKATRLFGPTGTQPRVFSGKEGAYRSTKNNRWCNPAHIMVKDHITNLFPGR